MTIALARRPGAVRQRRDAPGGGDGAERGPRVHAAAPHVRWRTGLEVAVERVVDGLGVPGRHEGACDVGPAQGVDAALDLRQPVADGQAEPVEPLEGLLDPRLPASALRAEEPLEGGVVRVHAEAEDVQLGHVVERRRDALAPPGRDAC